RADLGSARYDALIGVVLERRIPGELAKLVLQVIQPANEFGLVRALVVTSHVRSRESHGFVHARGDRRLDARLRFADLAKLSTELLRRVVRPPALPLERSQVDRRVGVGHVWNPSMFRKWTRALRERL